MSGAEVHESVPNIFEDLGRPDSETHMLKAQIVAELYRLCIDSGLADDAIAHRLGIPVSEVARLFRGDFRSYAIERLMGFLILFGRDIEIVSRPQATAEMTGSITFHAA